MRRAEGGKIDTVLYNASCGALNCTAKAGAGAAIGAKPIKNTAAAQNAGVLPRPPDRSRRFVSPILRHASQPKNHAETIAAVSRCQDRRHDSARKPGVRSARVTVDRAPNRLSTCHDLRSFTVSAIRGALRAGRLRHCRPPARKGAIED